MPLLVWSIVAAILGVILRAIESQDNFVAHLLAAVFAVAWSVMTHFVVPVIVFRDPSITEMFQESAKTFKDTWGESIGAMGTIDVVTFLLALGGVVLGAITDITITNGLVNQPLGTASLDFDVCSTDDTPIEMFVPDPERVDTEDANESVAMDVPHLTDPPSILETPGLSWYLDDSASGKRLRDDLWYYPDRP